MGQPSTAAAADAMPVRIAGATRYETAVELARTSYPTVGTYVVARGDLFPDALAASFLASLDNGDKPLLLVPPDRAPQSVLNQVHAYTPQGGAFVTIVGDSTAVSDGVEAQLRAAAGPGTTINRVAGADRYETAAHITYLTAEPRGLVFIVSGENYPDALAVGPAAFALGAPVLLTRASAVPDVTVEALRRTASSRVVLVGGTAVISEAAQRQIETACATARCAGKVERIAGADRQATATLVADMLLRDYPSRFSARHVNLVRGDDFADAVALAPHGGKEGAVTLFTRSVNDLGGPTREWLRSHSATVSSLHVIGDQTVVSDAVVADAVAAAA